MPSKDYVGVSLRISHPTSSPSEISKTLQREAKHTGIKGTPRGHPRGAQPRPPAVWREHYWCSDFDDGETPEARVGAIAAFLVERESEVTGLLQSGGTAYVYVFIGSDAAVGLEFDGPSLAILGRLGVTLGVEVMSGHQPLTDAEIDEVSARLAGATVADQEFIAHARQDVPHLLAEVVRLRRALKERSDS